VLIIGMVLFAGAFPNLLGEKGWALLAWIAYIPVFWVISHTSPAASIFWGALYGYGAYGLFNYWLSVFHPLAGLIVGFIYLVYMAILFPLLKGAEILFPRRGYIVQFLLWMGFEYLRTQGFLGYAYGITGYSQWGVLPVIQIADIFGVWGVSALVVFPSVWIAWGLRVGSRVSGNRERGTGNGGKRRSLEVPPDRAKAPGSTQDIQTSLPVPCSLFPVPQLKDFFRKEWLSAAVWAACLGAALLYGALARVDYTDAPKVNFALVQHNTDPWRGDIEDYRNNYRVLRRLSDEALAGEPKPDAVVWSETAFVPRIYWHQTYRDDPDSWDLVKELLDYLARQKVPFVIGNDDARLELTDFGRYERIDYNAVMLFEGGRNTQFYRKLHLVPFTEHFPYGEQLPWVYTALINADTHFWKKGDEAVVFTIEPREGRPGFRFSTPICFEDTFGYLSREFVRNGAELIVNLSNDAWSRSLPAQMQHLSMAVFRAVENRRAMVRSTASGQTCGIDPNGKILAMAPPFTEAFLSVEVPLVRRASLYTRFGDFFPRICIGGLIFLLIIKVGVCIIKKIRRRN
jgi:apolipoprotein N-acyltransferase